MSDPVTNVEIEDVLSSIRRLVSDEARTPVRSVPEIVPQAREDHARDSDHTLEAAVEEDSGSEETQAAGESAAQPALILTDALRVVDGDDTHDDVVQDDAETLVLSADHIAPDTDDADAAHEPEFGTGADDLSDDSEETVDVTSEHSDEAASDDVEPVANGADIGQSFADTLAQNSDTDSQDAVSPDGDEGEIAAQDMPIEDKIAALEALIGGNGEFEPDGAEDGANAAAARGEALPWRDSATDDDDIPAFIRQGALARTDPDSPSQDSAFDTETLAFRRAHEEATRTAAAELEADVTDTLLAQEEANGGFLDEDALRDMVADIVRLELQGPLGERITRNVRKLVRREIYRALAANELE